MPEISGIYTIQNLFDLLRVEYFQLSLCFLNMNGQGLFEYFLIGLLVFIMTPQSLMFMGHYFQSQSSQNSYLQQLFLVSSHLSFSIYSEYLYSLDQIAYRLSDEEVLQGSFLIQRRKYLDQHLRELPSDVRDWFLGQIEYELIGCWQDQSRGQSFWSVLLSLQCQQSLLFFFASLFLGKTSCFFFLFFL